MDVFRVTLAVLKLEPEDFEHYQCDQNIYVGVNLAQLLKVFRFSNNEDKVILCSSQNENAWDILFESVNGSIRSKFSLTLLNGQQIRYIIPDVTFDAVVEMSSVEFARITTILSQFRSNITISWTNVTVTFSTSNGQNGHGDITVSRNSIMNVHREGRKEFSTRYLCLFAEASSFSETVKLTLSGSSFPSIVEFHVPTSNDRKGKLQYYLSPLLSDNEHDTHDCNNNVINNNN